MTGKHLFFYALLGLCLGGTVLTSCSDDDSDGANDATSQKEAALQKAVADYVDHTVVPTYSAMADQAIAMYERYLTIESHFDQGTLTLEDVRSAGQAWNEARKYWELSEAFLYGAASDYNIDPHIDSWPLDKTAMDNMLSNEKQMAQMSPEYVGSNLGYGLLGFHAVEYMLFELSADGTASRPHSLTYTKPEITYLTSVAGDLCLQCIRLEAAWAGLDNVSDRKRQMLEEAELEPTFDYGWSMRNAGQGGSKYKSFQDAAEEIVQGCIDIADEVGNTKIGRPAYAASDEDRNYIESPYSLNSIVDFEDNIHSIENAYFGSLEADASLSHYIRSVNPDLDTRMRTAVDNAISAIRLIPEPFAKTATSAEAKAAAKACGTDLVDVLEEVMDQLTR